MGRTTLWSILKLKDSKYKIFARVSRTYNSASFACWQVAFHSTGPFKNMHKLTLLHAYRQHCTGLRQRWQEDNRVLLHSPIHLTTQTITWRNKTNTKDRTNDSGWDTPTQTGDCSPNNSWKHIQEQSTRATVCSKGSTLLRACWHAVYSWWLTSLPIHFHKDGKSRVTFKF